MSFAVPASETKKSQTSPREGMLWKVPIFLLLMFIFSCGVRCCSPDKKTQNNIDESVVQTKADTEKSLNNRKPDPKKKEIESPVFNGVVEYNGMRLEMVKIPAGTFMMGAPPEELNGENNAIQHKVILTKDYWLGKYEVTQAQWQAVMGNNPSHFKGDNCPVENITWTNAMKFCERLNDFFAKKLPQGYKFDLPTEAQWEYACRAETRTAYSYGRSSDASKMNYNAAYPYGPGAIQGKSYGKTIDVGSLGYKNDWGLYDMHGNVWEWCRDFYTEFYSSDSIIDPTGPMRGSFRVLRGGSWFEIGSDCRSAKRSYLYPAFVRGDIGFRLALVPVSNN